MKIRLMLIIVVSSLMSAAVYAQQGRVCLENICIGDDVDQLDVTWKSAPIDYKTKRAVESQLAQLSIDELYYEYNETLVTDKKTLADLAPHIITMQKFDQSVLDKLAKVRAICTPLSLTGEVDNDSSTKLFVTFRVVADEGGRGRLRVVQLEKEFNIHPPHLRPMDKRKYVALMDALKQEYPGIVQVRDIDARAASDKEAFATAIVGYRFFSDVRNPLILRVRDLSDFESIEFDENRSSQCPAVE